MSRESFRLNPIDHCYMMEKSPLYQPLPFSAWPSMNVVQDHGRIRKRCGYKADLTTASEVDVQGVYVYQRRDGTRDTIILSEEDVMVRKTGTDETFKYLTPMTTYTGTSQVDEIDASTKLVVTFEAGTTLITDGIEAGDYFILNEDWADVNIEVDASWREIALVNSETQLTLSTAYEKAVTTPGAKNATIRTVYTGMPTNGRWVVAVCDDTFCFSHGGVRVQKLTDTGAQDLDATYAIKARYMLTYANRLYLGDLVIAKAAGADTFTGSGLDDLTPGGSGENTAELTYRVKIDATGTPDTFTWSDDGGSTWEATGVAITGSAQTLNNAITVTFAATTGHTGDDYWEFTVAAGREPWSIQWSAEGDVEDWTDSTAGTADLIDSQDIITGLGRVGNKIIIYKKDSFHVGHRTGVATAHVAVPTHRCGAGLWAPYSLIHVEGTNAYQGREDFYILEGDIPKSIGAPMRDRFFGEVPEGATGDTWGCWDGARNRCMWFTGTKSLGQISWTWDYKEDAWTTFKFYHEITGAGMGGVG